MQALLVVREALPISHKFMAMSFLALNGESCQGCRLYPIRTAGRMTMMVALFHLCAVTSSSTPLERES